MDPQTWSQVKQIFVAASGMTIDARAAFVREMCNGDDALRLEVESLLRHDRSIPELADVPWAGRDGGNGVAAVMPALLPVSVGGIRIVARLGEGTSGVVFVGEQDSPRRRVAVKVLRDLPWSNGRGMQRFAMEAEALSRLSHPGIAQVLAAGREQPPPQGSGCTFIVLRLVEGESITTFCRRHALSVPERVRLMTMVCDAVQHAHQRGVVHRDLKPANIHVEGEPGSPRPVVLDFGIARLTDPLSAQAATLTGQILGTPAYMSPEQASGDRENIDLLSDVYAIGAITYELLADRPVYDVCAMDPARALCVVRTGQVAPLGHVARQCRGDIETIVMKALDRDRQRRYQSVSELAADLRRYLANEAIVARRSGTLYRLSLFVRRNKALVAATAVTFLGLVASLVVTTAALRRATHANDAARDTLQALLGQHVERHESVAGSADERRASLAAIKLHFGPFIQANHNQPEVLRYEARILRCEGRLLVGDGEDDLAEPLRVRSEAMLRDLAARYPNHRGIQADLSIAIIELGDLDNHRDRLDEARTRYEEARDMHAALVEMEPGNIEYLGLLAHSHERLAELAMVQSGNRQLRIELMEKERAVAERILSIDPAARSGLMTRSYACAVLGAMVREDGDRDRAEQYYAEARRAADSMLKLQENDEWALMQVAEIYGVLASLSRERLNFDERERWINAQEDAAAQLLRFARDHVGAVRLRAMAAQNRATLAIDRHDPVAAETQCRRAIALYRKLEARRPDGVGLAFEFACSLIWLGDVLDHEGRAEEARAEVIEGLQRLRTAATKPNANSTCILRYAERLMNVVLPDLQDPTTAVQLLESLVARSDDVDPGVLMLLAEAIEKAKAVGAEWPVVLPP